MSVPCRASGLPRQHGQPRQVPTEPADSTRRRGRTDGRGRTDCGRGGDGAPCLHCGEAGQPAPTRRGPQGLARPGSRPGSPGCSTHHRVWRAVCQAGRPGLQPGLQPEQPSPPRLPDRGNGSVLIALTNRYHCEARGLPAVPAVQEAIAERQRAAVCPPRPARCLIDRSARDESSAAPGGSRLIYFLTPIPQPDTLADWNEKPPLFLPSVSPARLCKVGLSALTLL